MKTIIITSLISSLLASLITFFSIGEKIVKVNIPASKIHIDSVATKKFEAMLNGIHRLFNTKEYQTFIDSLTKVSRRIITRTIRDTAIVIDTILVDCIPVFPGDTFSIPFYYSFDYPTGDTTKAKFSITYKQNDWPLNPTGRFENINISLPEIKRTVTIKKRPSVFLQYGSKTIFLGLGFLVGRIL